MSIRYGSGAMCALCVPLVVPYLQSLNTRYYSCAFAHLHKSRSRLQCSRTEQMCTRRPGLIKSMLSIACIASRFSTTWKPRRVYTQQIYIVHFYTFPRDGITGTRCQSNLNKADDKQIINMYATHMKRGTRVHRTPNGFYNQMCKPLALLRRFM